MTFALAAVLVATTSGLPVHKHLAIRGNEDYRSLESSIYNQAREAIALDPTVSNALYSTGNPQDIIHDLVPEHSMHSMYPSRFIFPESFQMPPPPSLSNNYPANVYQLGYSNIFHYPSPPPVLNNPGIYDISPTFNANNAANHNSVYQQQSQAVYSNNNIVYSPAQITQNQDPAEVDPQQKDTSTDASNNPLSAWLVGLSKGIDGIANGFSNNPSPKAAAMPQQ